VAANAGFRLIAATTQDTPRSGECRVTPPQAAWRSLPRPLDGAVGLPRQMTLETLFIYL